VNGFTTLRSMHFISMRPLNGAAWLVVLLCIVLLSSLVSVTEASAQTRKLKLYFLHTGERAEIAYKKNGRYSQSGLKKINRFLRDWRRNEPTKMDPKLLDLIWAVYKESGSKKYIHVISGYRSPKTNSLLRKRGRGVAKKSQHTLGKALDFFIPGVSLRKLRNIGLRNGAGGVGYYPKSGSPFVHMDTGRVRHWPRMSRKELVKVFPKGKTLHVPTDGKPLARYNQAKAEYERRSKGKIVVAKAEEVAKKPNYFAKILGRGEEDESGSGSIPAPKPVATIKKPSAAKAAPATPALEAKPLETPAPEVIPQPQTPALVLAAIPASALPVPVVAPRIVTPAPDLPQNDPIVAEVEQPVEQELQPELEPELQPDQESILVAAIPVRRPETVTQPDQPEVQIAAIEPTTLLQVEPKTQTSLTPGEIEDLRQQVYSALSSTRETRVAPVPSTGLGLAVPTPPEPVLEAPETVIASLPLEKTGNILSIVPQPKPTQVAADAIEQQLVLETIDGGKSAENKIAVPQVNPLASSKPETDSTLAIAAIEEPIEPGTASSGELVFPEPNPNRAFEVAALTDSRTVGVIPTRANRVPLPTPTLQEPVEIAEAPASDENQLTLEQFQSANLDERLVGKWALAADASIADIADIRPPAYGKNIIREIPQTVLTSGFSQELRKRLATKGFSGSSLEFLDFTRFE